MYDLNSWTLCQVEAVVFDQVEISRSIKQQLFLRGSRPLGRSRGEAAPDINLSLPLLARVNRRAAPYQTSRPIEPIIVPCGAKFCRAG